MAQRNQALDELVKNVEAYHEQYVKSLRTLHAGVSRNRSDTVESRNTVNEHFLPPARVVSGPIFDVASGSSHVTFPRPRRATLEVPVPPAIHPPSPQPLPVTPDPNNGEFLVRDEDLNFIRLLDPTPGPPSTSSLSSTQPAAQQTQPLPLLDETPRTSIRLTPLSFTDDMLLRHLRDADFRGQTARLLDDVLPRRRGDMDLSAVSSFREFAAYEREGYASTTFEVYDVGPDATARKTSVEVEGGDVGQGESVKYAGDGPYESQGDVVDAPMVWEAIRDVNMDLASVGRITIVQEPTPLILAALHLTMSPHFDMSEILHHFLSDMPNRGRTHACMHRAFERDPYPAPGLSSSLPPPPLSPFPSLSGQGPGYSFGNLRQRSFFFVFKYYTVVGPALEPAPWQRFDKRSSEERTNVDHVDIAECGSVLALSLGGDPTKPLRIRPRRERIREGFLFDTFGPWHLLSIQSFPDDQHTVRGDEFCRQKSFYNGPYAFLDLLIAEYRDAGKRNLILHESITKLITPPTEFMFDRKLRDKLLFEDKHFTYIRRYFWAYNTLAVINNGLKSMIAAYVETFTEDFWAGTHPLLWPVGDHVSPVEVAAYRDKMALLRRELDKVVSELGEVLKRNERTRKEIENLRDQLFSGSSIKESRRAIDQGDNIRILTMISMIFLPLTFVTSVFGITEFTIPANDWRFALTMVLVCIPFMCLVLLLQSRLFNRLLDRFLTYLKRLALLLAAWLSRVREYLAADASSSSSSSSPDGWSTAPPPPVTMTTMPASLSSHSSLQHPRSRRRRMVVVEEERWKRWGSLRDWFTRTKEEKSTDA